MRLEKASKDAVYILRKLLEEFNQSDENFVELVIEECDFKNKNSAQASIRSAIKRHDFKFRLLCICDRYFLDKE